MSLKSNIKQHKEKVIRQVFLLEKAYKFSHLPKQLILPIQGHATNNIEQQYKEYVYNTIHFGF